MSAVNWPRIYAAIAANLRAFGYPDITEALVREVHEAMRKGLPPPHGYPGKYAADQLEVWRGRP